MTNKEIDDYMKTVNPDFNSHIEKGTIEMNNEYYNLLEEKMARLINENQELKKQLEDYIKSNMKLKEELSNKRKEYQDTYKDVRIEIKEYKTQQKEFIKYLEDEIEKTIDIMELLNGTGSCRIPYLKFKKIILETILQKYIGIMGGKSE